MDKELIQNITTIHRALGVIEGVMLVSDLKVAEALGTAVKMIDDVLSEVTRNA